MSLKVDLKSQDARRGVSFDYGWIFVFVFLLVAFVVYYIQGLRLQSVVEQRKQELQSWKDKVAGFSGIQGRLEELKGEIRSIQDQITHLRELRYDPLRYSLLLVRLSKLLPSNIWISSLSIDPSQSSLSLTGSSYEMAGHPPLASLGKFLQNLQNDKDNYFFDILLQSTTASGKTGIIWTFSLTAKYNVPLIQSGARASSSMPYPGQAAPVMNQPAQSPSAPVNASPAAPETQRGSPAGAALPSAPVAQPSPSATAKETAPALPAEQTQKGGSTHP